MAKGLIGTMLVRAWPDGRRFAGRVVETEAYLGPRDAGCHTFGGRRTPRVASMWKQAGTGYIYFTYGMHHMLNVVCGPATVTNPGGGGIGMAVLIRAVEPIVVDSVLIDAENRSKFRDLCRGPGRLCKHLEMDRGLDGLDLTVGQVLWLGLPGEVSRVKVATSARVGLGNTPSPWLERKLRYFDGASSWVSGPRAMPVKPA